MIYFDSDKNPFGYKIKNPIATLADEIWLKYAGTDKWDIIDGVFTDISSTDAYKSKIIMQENLTKKAGLQSQIDNLEKIQLRAVREIILDSTNATAREKLTNIESQIVELRAQINSL